MSTIFTRRRLAILILAVVVLLGILAALYFLVWRPKGSDYESALSSVKKVITAQSDIQTEIAVAKYPGNFTPTNLTNLKTHLDEYSKATKELSQATVITKDSAVKSVYQAASGDLDSYKQSVTDVTTSLEQYMTTLYGCSSLYLKLGNLQTKAAFDTAARDCLDSVNNLDPPSKAFNDQFFTDYRKNTKTLVTAYSDKITAGSNKTAQATAQSTIETATKAIATVKPAIDYKLINLSKDLYSLYTTVSTQQNKLFR